MMKEPQNSRKFHSEFAEYGLRLDEDRCELMQVQRHHFGHRNMATRHKSRNYKWLRRG
jgi:hypothetical protein